MSTPTRKSIARSVTALLALGVVCLLAACGSAASSDSSTTGVQTGDTGGPTGSRPAPIIYRPGGLSTAHKVPLLVVLHGLGGSPSDMQRGTAFDQVANAHGFVVAYLGSDSTSHPWSPHGDDLPYVSSMITQVTRSQNVDPRRVYVTGFSAGAAFTYIVACKLSSQVAGIAPVSAVMNTVVTAPCALAHPISQLTIIGNQDGAFNGRAPRVLSAVQTAATWRAKNGCPSSVASFTGRSGSAAEKVWSNCVDGSAVGLYVIVGGAHYWPGNTENGQFGLSPSHPDRQFNASQAIWAFMSGHAAGTKVAASISSIRVRKVSKRSVVTVSFRIGEPLVVACTLALGAGRKLTKTLHLGRGSHTRAVLKAPHGTAAGGHLVTCVFKDAYSRILTQRRKVVLT